VPARHEPLLRAAYAAFNARDVDAAVALMTPDVDWPNAWEGGRVVGRDAVREYWTRQWREIDPAVEPVAFTEEGPDHVAVTVHQVVRGLDGELLSEGRVTHSYRIRDGLVQRMDVRQ
jgi:ketosteroid isomerase-like protein